MISNHFIGALLASLFFASCASSIKDKGPPLVEPLKIETIALAPIEFADQKLRDNGFEESFISEIHHRYLKRFDWEASTTKIIELNVFGFLYHSDYSLHDTKQARSKISAFLKLHKSSFAYSKKQYQVDPKVIAALLWVETKYGKTTGSFELPFVYYSLILGSHPFYIKRMLALLPSKATPERMKDYTVAEAEQKIYERCKSKAVWSLEEMKAIHEIKARGFFNPFRRKASFAGAFGLAQFIPTTYLKYASSEFRAKPDLSKYSDAISSVANYLKESGWSEDSLEAKTKALYSYNHSKGYGAVILKLASEQP